MPEQSARRHNREWVHLARTIAFGTAGCVVAALAISYLMLFFDNTNSLQRSFLSAAILGTLIGVPLFGFLGLKLREIRHMRRELNRAARVDLLTSCFNGSAFSSLVDSARLDPLSSPKRRQGALLVVEAEHLRSINHRFGHRWGDEALRVIADAIRKSIRSGDMVGRVGSSEFAVFLPDASEDNARDVGERICASVAQVYFAPSGSRDILTVSVGGTIFEDQIEYDDMFRAAEEQLHNAQTKGIGNLALSRIGEVDHSRLQNP